MNGSTISRSAVATRYISVADEGEGHVPERAGPLTTHPRGPR